MPKDMYTVTLHLPGPLEKFETSETRLFFLECASSCVTFSFSSHLDSMPSWHKIHNTYTHNGGGARERRNGSSTCCTDCLPAAGGGGGDTRVVVKAKNKWNIHFLFLNTDPLLQNVELVSVGPCTIKPLTTAG